MNTACNIELDYIDKKKLLFVHINIFTSSNCRKTTWKKNDVDVLDVLDVCDMIFWSSTECVVRSYEEDVLWTFEKTSEK